MDTPNFDNVILSKSAWDGMKDKIQIANAPLSLFGSVKIVTSDFVPENMMILRQGDKVVTIVKIGGEAPKSTHPTKANPRWWEVLINKIIGLFTCR